MRKTNGDLQSKPRLAASPNYGKQSNWVKLKRKVRTIILKKINNTPLQFRLYRSYWHYRIQRNKQNLDNRVRNESHFLTQRPNYGAGIGHQLANWNSGLFFANYFNVRYAHSPFSTDKWESFFGFGENEIHVSDLEESKGYKVVRLPRFDSTSNYEINLIANIISSYKSDKVLFFLELDQGYKRQYETKDVLSEKFFSAKSRSNDNLIFVPDAFNIAVHIRRRMKIETTEVWRTRGLENEYFVNALSLALNTIETEKKIEIYLFSQGDIEEFSEFEKFKNMHYCMDMGPIDSVLHMINADLLISSKSSFSYNPALISKGIQIVPKTFWHSYPGTSQYILADNDGNFDINHLKNKFI